MCEWPIRIKTKLRIYKIKYFLHLFLTTRRQIKYTSIKTWIANYTFFTKSQRQPYWKPASLSIHLSVKVTSSQLPLTVQIKVTVPRWAIMNDCRHVAHQPTRDTYCRRWGANEGTHWNIFITKNTTQSKTVQIFQKIKPERVIITHEFTVYI